MLDVRDNLVEARLEETRNEKNLTPDSEDRFLSLRRDRNLILSPEFKEAYNRVLEERTYLSKEEIDLLQLDPSGIHLHKDDYKNLLINDTESFYKFYNDLFPKTVEDCLKDFDFKEYCQKADVSEADLLWRCQDVVDTLYDQAIDFNFNSAILSIHETALSILNSQYTEKLKAEDLSSINEGKITLAFSEAFDRVIEENPYLRDIIREKLMNTDHFKDLSTNRERYINSICTNDSINRSFATKENPFFGTNVLSLFNNENLEKLLKTDRELRSIIYFNKNRESEIPELNNDDSLFNDDDRYNSLKENASSGYEFIPDMFPPLHINNVLDKTTMLTKNLNQDTLKAYRDSINLRNQLMTALKTDLYNLDTAVWNDYKNKELSGDSLRDKGYQYEVLEYDSFGPLIVGLNNPQGQRVYTIS